MVVRCTTDHHTRAALHSCSGSCRRLQHGPDLNLGINGDVLVLNLATCCRLGVDRLLVHTRGVYVVRPQDGMHQSQRVSWPEAYNVMT